MSVFASNSAQADSGLVFAQLVPTKPVIKTEPSAISLRISIPRSCQLFAHEQKALEEKLQSFFFLKPLFRDGIAILHLETIGNPDGFQERLQWLIGQLRAEISPDLRFCVEVEY